MSLYILEPISEEVTQNSEGWSTVTRSIFFQQFRLIDEGCPMPCGNHRNTSALIFPGKYFPFIEDKSTICLKTGAFFQNPELVRCKQFVYHKKLNHAKIHNLLDEFADQQKKHIGL